MARSTIFDMNVKLDTGRPVVRHVRGVKSRPLQERGDDYMFL